MDRSDASANIKDIGVYLMAYVVPCSCACRHCSVSSKKQADPVEFSRIVKFVERFFDWRKEKKLSDVEIFPAIGYCFDFPQVADYVRWLNSLSCPYADELNVNGLKHRDNVAWTNWLKQIKDAGTTTIRPSFYGLHDTHDNFARRKDDLKYLLSLCKQAATLGLKRSETIFISNRNLTQMDELLDILDSIPHLSQRILNIMSYKGSAKQLELERPTWTDIEQLSDRAKKYFNPKIFKTESEWIDTILRGDYVESLSRAFRVVITGENIDTLESQSCDEIIGSLRQTDNDFQQNTPHLLDLAKSFGDTTNKRLYRLRDLKMKWTECFYKEHPELDATGLFDELTSGTYRD